MMQIRIDWRRLNANGTGVDGGREAKRMRLNLTEMAQAIAGAAIAVVAALGTFVVMRLITWLHKDHVRQDHPE